MVWAVTEADTFQAYIDRVFGHTYRSALPEDNYFNVCVSHCLFVRCLDAHHNIDDRIERQFNMAKNLRIVLNEPPPTPPPTNTTVTLTEAQIDAFRVAVNKLGYAQLITEIEQSLNQVIETLETVQPRNAEAHFMGHELEAEETLTDVELLRRLIRAFDAQAQAQPNANGVVVVNTDGDAAVVGQKRSRAQFMPPGSFERREWRYTDDAYATPDVRAVFRRMYAEALNTLQTAMLYAARKARQQQCFAIRTIVKHLVDAVCRGQYPGIRAHMRTALKMPPGSSVLVRSMATRRDTPVYLYTPICTHSTTPPWCAGTGSPRHLRVQQQRRRGGPRRVAHRYRPQRAISFACGVCP